MDYDALLEKIKFEYPNCATIIDAIADILPPQSKEWQTIIVEAKNGNAYAKERMVKMYLRTVMKQAYYFSKDNLFPSYFPLWVRQYMQRESTIKGTILRYPAHYRDQLNIIVSDASDVIDDDNFEEAVGLVGKKVKNQAGVTDEEICKYILPYVELPEDLEAEDSIGNMLQGTMKEIIDEILKSLNERERFVLELRYGFIDNQERTLEEVGNT